ncbi:hypothetical protein [Microbacterium xanthum]|uniref:hypothetical protein n=1 Tax=Microbacterium xanthum TaxID=3079794 RepID=UPI002AD31B86|nr:hypothetical protein [Microbacterium sp. KSW-48]MDZ8172899.1 hypothetical protein [Microbacterium sp. KSW-48]
MTPLTAPPRRVAAVFLLAGTLALSAGCTPAAIDSELWRQLDAQENVVYTALTEPHPPGTFDTDSPLDALRGSTHYWDGFSDPTFIEPAIPATVIYNESEHQDRFGDPVLDIDVFVTSGHNTDGPANSGDRFDSTPSSIHTCYRLSISLVAGQVWSSNRSSDFLDEQLTCPEELVRAAGEHTQYREPHEFDG